MSIQKTRLSGEKRLAQYRSEHLSIVFASAASALQSAFLVNSGGAVALLAFFGQFIQAGKPNPAMPGLTLALFILVFDTFLAGLATGLSFLAQYGYFMRGRSRLGKIAPYLTKANIGLVMLSYICFVSAGAVAYFALSCG